MADSTQLQQCGLDQDAVAALTARTITVNRTDRRDVVALDDLRGAAPGRPRLRAAAEPMLITHTSGTTGIPKLVLHSAESIHSLALVEAERWPVFGLRSSDTVAYGDPFFHQRMATAMAAVATVTPSVLMLSENRLLAEARRVLRPGGVFTGSDSTASFLFRLAHLGDTMVLIDPDRFASRLRAAGFTDARVWRANHAFGFRAIRPQTQPGS